MSGKCTTQLGNHHSFNRGNSNYLLPPKHRRNCRDFSFGTALQCNEIKRQIRLHSKDFGGGSSPDGSENLQVHTTWFTHPSVYLGWVGQNLLHVLGHSDGTCRLYFIHKMPQHRRHPVAFCRLIPGAEAFPSPDTGNA